MKYEMLSKEIKDKIAEDTHCLEESRTELDSGRVELVYHGSVSDDNNKYNYTINWIGFDDGEDGGMWSEPYDIYREAK